MSNSCGWKRCMSAQEKDEWPLANVQTCDFWINQPCDSLPPVLRACGGQTIATTPVTKNKGEND
eukprot:CAMPEP_0174360768 /NCGR_PEP_ID=MMETSP0811_2-20130205/55887_1 /TAXON_ID=73025 ORGANISM="Eutreptiella gymnastica-like, Strain CCMP1594" /NCGR_SAMPLE_ID=MMETSP0811_2 /ASSEMBLY_ACC=CAM_ASM_000667 /LENGTH=63 /DNA_ID=CAMNT_0015496837 /DNA_START=111 /DNA_END=302 /DNA_ORIENTATION=-